MISELNKKYDFRLILAGGPDDKIDATEIEKGLNIKNVISLCDLKLTSCLDYIQDGKLYIGNDTSFMHLAAGYGLKVTEYLEIHQTYMLLTLKIFMQLFQRVTNSLLIKVKRWTR